MSSDGTRFAAGNERDVEAAACKSARDRRRAAQMADAQQMLDVKQDPRRHAAAPAALPPFSGTFNACTDGFPSVSSANRCRQS